ncbi:MAG TPA: metal-dependent hydrolase [Spirochaetota bacterium]|nr:metal-dependent hydrolase [Spirochaetota bacterium]
MTPPEHVFIGLSLGNIIYCVQALMKKIHLRYRAILALSGLFAILPDIDSFFGNYASRDVFTGHRGITHSLVFVLLAAAAPALIVALYGLFVKKQNSAQLRPVLLIIFITSFVAGLSHLIADLPQPSGPWGGIPLFFPLSHAGEYTRTGGCAKIGWYDYLIQWSYLAVFLISSALILSATALQKTTTRGIRNTVAIAVIAITMALYLWTFSYINKSVYKNEPYWTAVQNGHLDDLGPAVKELTLKGKNFFLYLFFKVR